MTLPLFAAQQETATSDDYYTPSWVFETLGVEFDLDVAAPPGGVPWIPAKRFYTKADDGLAQPWEGRVWCNPPYSAIAGWVDRMALHHNGICLVPFFDSGWLTDLWAVANVITLMPSKFVFVFKGTKQGVMARAALFGFGEWTREPLSRIGHIR